MNLFGVRRPGAAFCFPRPAEKRRQVAALQSVPRPNRRRSAFTFVEVLAALLFLAVVVPAVVTALTVSNRAAEITDRGSLAGELAENKLNELLVDNAWQSAGSTGSGTFGDDLPGYRWEMTANTWATDTANAVSELRVEVFYPVQGKERSVRLTTLVNPSATTAGNNASTTP